MKPLIEYDKTSILSEEVFVEIFEQEDEITKARMLLSCRDRAKELGVTKAFDDLTATYKRVEKTQLANQRRTSTTMMNQWTNFTGPYDNMMCGAWIAGDNGINTFSKDYSNEVLACYHPILPIKRMKNMETGEEQLQIAYKRNHSWREITVPKDLVSSASKIVALSKLGVAVTSENAKLLVKYLSDVENLNEDEIPVQMSSSKLGWIGDGFIPYDTDIVFDGDMQFKQVYESIACYGNKQKWMDYVRALRKTNRIEIKFFLAASFASILVGQTGALPFIVDLWGETEGGKTVTLMLAASVWANPADSQYIGDFKTTDVALEAKCNLLNHLPLILDDSSKVSARIRDNFEGVVYDLCSGKGKSRSNKELGIRKENYWKNVIITNGERPLASYVSQGGAINRILEVECGEHIFSDPQEAVEIFKKNYGYAGKQFVKIVKQMGADEVREIQREIQREIYEEDKMQKQSIALSIVLTADKIATERLFCDGEYIDLEEAKRVLNAHQDVSEHDRCYRYLLDKIAMNNQKFDAETKVEKWGTFDQVDGDDYAVIYTQAFKELCSQGGFSDKAFLSWADKKGKILTAGGRFNKLKKINGKPIRCVFLKLNEIEDDDGFIPSEDYGEIYAQEELPFAEVESKGNRKPR